MDTTTGIGQLNPPSVDLVGSSVTSPVFAPQAGAVIVPQVNGLPCRTCGTLPATLGSDAVDAVASPVELSYVYAVGQIEPRFPTLALEKEFAQVARLYFPNEPSEPTDPQVIERLLSDNRYLVRQLCWVLTIEDQPAYILRPRDPRGYEMLLDAVRVLASVPRATQNAMDRRDAAMNVVVGVAGPPAPPDLCNGMQVPMVVFDQIFSLTQSDLVQMGREARSQLREARVRLPAARAEGAEPSQRSLESDVSYLLQAVDNLGRTPEHRALNFVVTREPIVHALTARVGEGELDLAGINTRPSRLSGVAEGRLIFDVILAFGPQGLEQYFLRVDVTGEFPFVVTPLQRFYFRS
jgi:hypothetical protein